MPTSSSHAPIGGLIGAGMASATAVHWWGVGGKVVLPMLVTPIIGVAAGYLLHTGILWASGRT